MIAKYTEKRKGARTKMTISAGPHLLSAFAGRLWRKELAVVTLLLKYVHCGSAVWVFKLTH
jgi:hypothetical protein